MSYKPEIQGKGETTWTRNALAFATYEEANRWGRGLLFRWTESQDARVATSDEPVNAMLDDHGRLVMCECPKDLSIRATCPLHGDR